MKNHLEDILKIVQKLSGVQEITLQQSLLDEGIIDSLMTIELITNLETHFNINIDFEELNHHNFNSVINISQLIESKISSGNI